MLKYSVSGIVGLSASKFLFISVVKICCTYKSSPFEIKLIFDLGREKIIN
jgi:hypothetical protein